MSPRAPTGPLYTWTVVVVLARWALGGVEYGDLVVSAIDGTTASLLIGAAGAVYWGRRHTESRAGRPDPAADGQAR